MHCSSLGHDTDEVFVELGSAVETHAEVPPVGPAEVIAVLPRTQVHKAAEAHET